MELGRFLVGQKDARVVVEFENDDWTLYPIIEWVVSTVCTNPAEEGLAEMALYLLLSDFSRSVWQVQQEILGDV